MRRKITVLLIVIVCFLLQTTFFKSLSFLTVSPNLLVIVTASFGFIKKKKEGMYIGLLCGCLIDIFYGDYLGVNALIYMYIGYLNGFFRQLFFPDEIGLPMFLIAVSDLSCNFAVYFFRFLFRNRLHFFYYLWHIMLPELVFTLLMMIIIYYVILKINRRLEDIAKRSAAKFV